MASVPDIDDGGITTKTNRLNFREAQLKTTAPFIGKTPVYSKNAIGFNVIDASKPDMSIGFSELFNCRCYIKKLWNTSILNIQPADDEEEQFENEAIAQAITLAEITRHFEREIEISHLIQHYPYILRSFAFLKDPDEPEFIDSVVLEYGPNVAEFLQANPFISEETLWRWAFQLSKVMLYLHEGFQIMHRAIRPDSVFVFNGGRDIKLGNFTYSRIRHESNIHSITSSKNMEYAAPETLNSHGRVKYCYSVDVWSYGMFLYYITHRRAPFDEGITKRSRTFRRHLEEGNRPTLSEFPAFHNLIQHCWKTEKQDSHGNVADEEPLRPTFREINDHIRVAHPPAAAVG